MPPGPRRPALAGEALSGLEEAVLEGSPERAGDLADADDNAARDQLVALAENAASAEVADFSLRYVDELGGVAEDGTWQAAVDTSWAFRGFDPTPALAEVRFGFRVDGDRAVITSVGGGDRRSPLWMTTPLVVRRDAGTLVLVAGDAREADRFEALAQAAVPAVHGVLPRWRPRLVVEVPPTLAALHGALDSDPGQYDAVAAVTSTADGSLTPDAPVHVFVNPEVFGDLKPRGAQVVMSHEAVHVATDAATSTMPLWLLEGFADYVALRDVHLPVVRDGRADHRQVRARRRRRRSCPGRPSSTPRPPTSGRRTRAPGWPAGSWPTSAGRLRWWTSTAPWMPAPRWTPRCARSSASAERELTSRWQAPARGLAG